MNDWIYMLGIIASVVAAIYTGRKFAYNSVRDALSNMKSLENRLSTLENDRTYMRNSIDYLRADLTKHNEDETRQWALVNEMNTNTEVISTQLISLSEHYSDMKETLKEINKTLHVLNGHETRIRLLEAKQGAKDAN